MDGELSADMEGEAHELARAKRAEAERGLLASIVDNSDDAIIGKTLQGVVTSWNKAAEDMFVYSAEEMIGQPLAILFPPELSAEEEVLARLGRGERIEHYETTRLRKDRSRIEVSLSVSPVRHGGGR